MIRCIAVALLCCAFQWASAATTSYLDELQQRSRNSGLAQQPAWRDLLHVKQHPLTRQIRSLADDPGFFLALNGARDPQAELDASLAAFFDASGRHAEGQTAQCRFRARYEWLREQLGFDAARLPEQPCTRYDQWREGLHTRSISLIFPAAFLNSPASMYGHTFLRLNVDGPNADQPLLAYAISYAANGNEAEGLGFAFKGLTGLYSGIFTNAPYYLKIREYTHLENRDIWEYELDLTPAEVDRLLAHTWELGFTRFDYFFFDENCSYHLLSLLDVARPGLHLTDQFTWWAIPVDTVRAVVQASGLLKSTHYRPSNSSDLQWRAAQLPRDQVLQAKALGEGSVTPAAWAASSPAAADEAQVRTLELAERYATYRAAQGELRGAAFERLRLQLLTARAALPALPELAVPVPDVPPQAGHGTARVDLSAGRRNGKAVWNLALRPAYHDLGDPEEGYSRGAQIQFLALDLGQTEGQGMRLQRFTPVDIVSLTPTTAMLGGTSWKVRFGLVRSFANTAANAPLAVEVNGGPGHAWELREDRRALAYVFMDNQLWYDKSLAATPWAVGSGLQAGLLLDLGARWRIQLEAGVRAFVGPAREEHSASMRHRFSLDARDNLSVLCQWRRRGSAAIQRECQIGLQRYW